MIFGESKTRRTRHARDEECVALPRSADSVLRLLRHGNWIRAADVRRALRVHERQYFDSTVKMLLATDAVVLRTSPEGDWTELRLAAHDEGRVAPATK